ncbi:class I SAM-dependent methyltransferase [Campylobacter helveticus]|uniref:class I SAM-dependent methyltransferase n=1 Tax=Campylobacter helveticus TaxID=28898 RepID=UPI00214A711E|nr:class I SAM-dependent methyltransferase [Campylobacter helveticus]MCR2065470.1 class I SAM-dependent methyltransferase [Campylobacter helveticus]
MKGLIIDGFFEKKALEGKKFDLIAHSHTFEHIYEPNKFLNECAQMLGGGNGL